MPYQVTYINTPQTENPPGFTEWLATLEPSVMADYPEYSDAVSVVNSFVPETVLDPSKGFISETVTTDDNGVTTLVTFWESQEDWEASVTRATFERTPSDTTGNISCQTDSVTITGLGTAFTTELQSGDILYTADLSQDASGAVKKNIGTISSISSDTELTLASNAEFVVNNLKFGIVIKQTALNYLQDLYNQTYPTTTEVTYANV